MRKILFIFFLLFSAAGFSQNVALAKNYFQQGEFEKSRHVYQQLVNSNPTRLDYLVGLVQSLQQLEEFDEAERAIRNRIARIKNQPQLWVELGYNFYLQNKLEEAEESFKEALENVKSNPNLGYTVGRSFHDYNLLDEAIIAYQTAMELNDKLDYNVQVAQIYGEQGNLEKMFNSFLDVIERNPSFKSNAQRYFSMYIEEDPSHEPNIVLRQALLQRTQKNPEIIYNELLSWLFVQQKEYKKAFTQERAIYRRGGENDLNGIVNLSKIAIADGDYDSAREIIDYVVENAFTPYIRLQGNEILMKIEVETATPKQYAQVEKKFEKLFEEQGTGKTTLMLQIDYNHFLAFKSQKKEEAIANLRKLLKESLSPFEESRVKMELADILVSDEKFNQALVLYSQIQNKIQSDALAQEARFKVARTSYFKGDFEWAQTQLDVLKKSTSQLIANDAMQLSLLIRDNSWEDSTQTALKKYARADLLDLQEKHIEAIQALDEILTSHKGESIEDEALLKQGMIYEKVGDYQRAESNYLKIIQFYSQDILADDALFYLARLYETKLGQPEKAKEYYEQIVFNHADSIYFVEARRKFRMLRGDAIN